MECLAKANAKFPVTAKFLISQVSVHTLAVMKDHKQSTVMP